VTSLRKTAVGHNESRLATSAVLDKRSGLLKWSKFAEEGAGSD